MTSEAIPVLGALALRTSILDGCVVIHPRLNEGLQPLNAGVDLLRNGFWEKQLGRPADTFRTAQIEHQIDWADADDFLPFCRDRANGLLIVISAYAPPTDNHPWTGMAEMIATREPGSTFWLGVVRASEFEHATTVLRNKLRLPETAFDLSEHPSGASTARVLQRWTRRWTDLITRTIERRLFAAAVEAIAPV